MPYPNEHSCRIKSPDEFQPDSFRRIKNGKLNIIVGRLKGESKTTTQAFRYPKDDYSEDEARTHCKEQGGTFEPAEAESHNAARGADWLPVAKAEQVKQLSDGKKMVLTEQALKSSVGTWAGGPVSINHKVEIPGEKLTILGDKYERPFLYLKLSPEVIALFRDSDASGWSVELDNLKFDDSGEKIIEGSGVGISLLFLPHVPACTREMGCNETMVSFEVFGDERTAFEEDGMSKLKAAYAMLKEYLFGTEHGNFQRNEQEGNRKEVKKIEMDEAVEKQLRSDLDETKKAKAQMENELKQRDDTLAELTKRIAAFEQVEKDRKTKERETQWEQVKKILPPGKTHKPEDEAKLKAMFMQDPYAILVELAGMSRPAGTTAEGEEFESQDADDGQAVIDAVEKEAGLGFEVKTKK